MGVQIKQLSDSSMGLEGTDFNTGAFIYINIPYTSASPLIMSGVVLPRKCVVQAVTVNADVSATNAVTVTAYAAPSGTALGAGTALMSAGAVLNGTAGANVVSVLSVVSGALLVASGSRVGVVISGALGVAGSGVITIALNPA